MLGYNFTCLLRDGAPTAMAVLGYVVDQLLIFLRRPQAFPQLLLVAARVLPHFREAPVGMRSGTAGETVGESSQELNKGSGGEAIELHEEDLE